MKIIVSIKYFIERKTTHSLKQTLGPESKVKNSKQALDRFYVTVITVWRQYSESNDENEIVDKIICHLLNNIFILMF